MRLSPALGLLECLATPHGVDRYLEALSPRLAVREVRAEVVAVRRQTARSVTLTLRPTRSFAGFRAGQHVQVAVEVDGRRQTRSYSLASSEHRADGLLELTVAVHPQGRVSGHLHTTARPGVTVGLSQAQGELTLPADRPPRVLLVSGGSGITPVLSMLRTLADEGHRGEVTFVHYARTAADLCYAAELDAVAARHPGLRVVRVFTRDGAGSDAAGRLTAEAAGLAHLDAAAPRWRDAQAYVCGPSGLVDAAETLWADAGRADQLHVERFAPPRLAPRSAPGSGATVLFAGSDRLAADTGATLLEQAEAAGLTPTFGCRMGVCHSCTRIKTSGAVRDLRTGAVSAEPDESVQICVSVPVGDVTIDL